MSSLYSAFSESGAITTKSLLKEADGAVPLSVTLAEYVDELRAWVNERARPGQLRGLLKKRGLRMVLILENRPDATWLVVRWGVDEGRHRIRFQHPPIRLEQAQRVGNGCFGVEPDFPVGRGHNGRHSMV